MRIKTVLIEKYGYSIEEAEHMENDLSSLSNQIRPIYEKWKDDGADNDPTEIRGYSIDSLRSEFGMNFFAALVTLDWIVREPETAIAALKEGIL